MKMFAIQNKDGKLWGRKGFGLYSKGNPGAPKLYETEKGALRGIKYHPTAAFDPEKHDNSVVPLMYGAVVVMVSVEVSDE